MRLCAVVVTMFSVALLAFPAEAIEPTGEQSVTQPSAPARSARGQRIAPTVSRAPIYWNCQDALSERIVTTFLDTAPPTLLLHRGGEKVIATLYQSASGSKYLAPGGIVFWIKGNRALVEWPSGSAFQCASLGG